MRYPAAFAALLLCPLFVHLGLWQLDRADSADALAKTLAKRPRLPPVVIDGSPMEGEDRLFYRRAIVRGRYEHGDRIFLDNRTFRGRLGYHLIVPMKIAGSAIRVLINCGWVPRDGTDGDCGDSAPATGLIVQTSVPPLRLAEQSRWNNHWPYLDLEYFATRHGYPVRPFVVLRDPHLIAEALRTAKGRSQRWGMHIGYALQWFFFAALSLILFVFLLPLRWKRS